MLTTVDRQCRTGDEAGIIGHQKGRGTRARIERNFGQPRPEGYRKALRVMRLAEKFGRPVLTLVDTPGAYPGVGAGTRTGGGHRQESDRDGIAQGADRGHDHG